MFLYDRKYYLRTYNVMAQSSSLSVEIWFPTNNLSCGSQIAMKFWYNVSSHKMKVGINFGGCGPYRLGKRVQKGPKWVFFKKLCRMFIFIAILIILSLLYSLLNCVNKIFAMDLIVFKQLKNCGGSNRGNTQKKFSFLIFGLILKILLSFDSSWKFLW